MSVHLVLLALSCGALAASAAGGPIIGITRDLRRARQVSILVSATLLTGNAVCLLPGTPAWYSAALVTLSVGGLVWMAVSLMVVRSGSRLWEGPSARSVGVPAVAYARETPPHLMVISGGAAASRAHASLDAGTANKVPASTSAASAAPQANSAQSHGSRAHGAQAHLSVLPGGQPAGNDAVATSSYAVVDVTDVTCWDDGVTWDAPEQAVVTRRQLDTIGPRWSRAQGVSVARGIRTYAPQAGRRRAEGSGFGPRAHSVAGSVLQAQLRALYSADAPTASERLGGTQA